jgi:tRNA U34 5-methylaminomethyl-2-thiouridine-forming methyltransferase MnmC
MSGDYQLVELANGTRTLFSSSYGEKMHPGLGPAAEAEQLYVRQLKICERLESHAGEFVIWDIGLGAAANALATLRATREIAGKLHLISFDNTNEPLEFALKNSEALSYVAGFEPQISRLLEDRRVVFQNGRLQVEWDLYLGDFPSLVKSKAAGLVSVPQFVEPPHAIYYDAFSPAKNPAMWALPVFENLFHSLAPGRTCALTTYSRSTLVRATLLMAGFYVGVGHATGMKEETTIASNDMSLIAEPLDSRWLERAARSDSAQPMPGPGYSRQRLSVETLTELRRKPQFQT